MRKGEKIWINQRQHGDILEIILRDSTRRKIASWVINVNDKKRARQIMKILKMQYNIDFGIDLKEEEDIQWLP